MFEFYKNESESFQKVFLLNNKIIKGLISNKLLKMSDLDRYKMPYVMDDIIPNIEKMSGQAKLLTDIIADILNIESFLKIDKNNMSANTLIGEDFIVTNNTYFTTNPLSGYIQTLKNNIDKYEKEEILFNKIGYITTSDFLKITEGFGQDNILLDKINVSKLKVENILNDLIYKAIETEANSLQIYFRNGKLNVIYVIGSQLLEEEIENMSIQMYEKVSGYIIDLFGDTNVVLREHLSNTYKLRLTNGYATEELIKINTISIKISNLSAKINDLFNKLKLPMNDQKGLIKSINTPYGLFIVSSKTNKKENIYSIAKKELQSNPESRIYLVEKEIEKDFKFITQVETEFDINLFKHIDFSSYNTIIFEQMNTSEELEFALALTTKGKKVIIGMDSNSAIEAFAKLHNNIQNKSLLVDNLLGIIQIEKINKVCPSCSKSTLLFKDINFQDFSSLENIPKMSQEIRVENDKGCDACFKGYNGYLEVAEYLHNDDILKSAIIDGFKLNNLKIEKNSDSWFNIYENSLPLLENGFTTTNAIINALGFPRKI